MRRIILSANTGWYLYNFRLPLLKKLREAGHSVAVLCPEDEYSHKIRTLGFRHIAWNVNRKGMNPLGELAAFFHLFLILARERPHLLHNHTVKCVLYGSLAALLLRVPQVLNSITGLGHLFLSDTLATRSVRKLMIRAYQLSSACGAVFIFQNETDKELFEGLGVRNTALIEGSGVSLERFSAGGGAAGEGVRILFAGRLLREKGLYELVEAVRILKRQGYSFTLRLAGGIDQGNPSAVPKAEVERWAHEGLVEWLGHVDPIDGEILAAHIVALPSWREGMPKVLLEALAAGKAVVTTDVPGCRDLVNHGATGLLAPARNAPAFAAELRRLLDDPDLRHRLGRAGRASISRRFDEATILGKTFSLYNFKDIPRGL